MACAYSFSSSRGVSSKNVAAPAPPSVRQSVVARATEDPAASIKAIEVTDKNFKSLVLDNPLPVLVDFWAPWCGPCRILAPVIDDVADALEGQLVCVKLNTDEYPDIATEYGIRSIPTVMVFKGGKRLDTVIGAVPKDSLMKTIDKVMS